MDKQTFKIKGMHCASCASIIEKKLKKTEGVESAEVNYGTETAKVSFDDARVGPKHLSEIIEPFGYSLVIPEEPSQHAGHTMKNMTAEEMGMSPEEHAAHLGLGQSKQEKLAELKDMKSKVLAAVPLTLISLFVMAWDSLAQFGVIEKMPYIVSELFHHLLPVLATYALFVIGKPYLAGLFRFLRFGHANMDTLIGIGTLTAFVYSLVVSAFEEPLAPFLNVEQTYYDVTIVVIAFITFGKYLEARSKIKTGDAIEKLLNLQAKTAIVIRDGHEIEIPVSEVLHEDIVVVKPAGKIPVDGVVTEGSSYVDESMISGEPIPVEKTVGSKVKAGTINTTGAFSFRATKVGSETMLANIIRMVEEAQGSRAPIQALADKISAVFVPIVIAIAFAALGGWLLVGTPYFGFAQALSFGLVSFVGVLVIACPCALGLATPTAIIVGVGKGAREGILVKDAATLERLHKATVVVVDKTGTITKGKPEFVSIKSVGDMSDEDILAKLGALESKSEHPIATAIVSHVKTLGLAVPAVEKFEVMKGEGVRGTIDGIEYFAGNVKLMLTLGTPFDAALIEKETREGKTPIILATREKILGIVLVADVVKPEAKDAVARLHKLGIKVVMLTGDNANTARFIADQVGIDEVVAEVSPESKLQKIQELQKNGEVVAMAGDGINDAPALARADVGIAMSTGTDVAIESAGITLLNGDISKIAQAIRLSKMTMRGIKQNLFFAFVYNIVGIPLAAGVFYPVFGWLLSPVFAGLAMALSSVSVISNSLRIKAREL